MNETKPSEFDNAAKDASDAIHGASEVLCDLPDTHAADYADVLTPDRKPAPPEGPKRAGYTKSHGRKRNKARARMAKTSRVRNR